jgi:hypothetical protein
LKAEDFMTLVRSYKDLLAQVQGMGNLTVVLLFVKLVPGLLVNEHFPHGDIAEVIMSVI